MSTFVFISPWQMEEIPDSSTQYSKYSNLITSQHSQKPNFMSWLAAALLMVTDNSTTQLNMPAAFDIDQATGAQLDIIGGYVGRSRTLNYTPASGASPKLDDTHYRIALKAKIAQNSWDGTIQSMYAIWNALFPGNALSIVDNQNMTMSAVISGSLDALTLEMIANKLIIPKPSGVGLTIISSTPMSIPTSTGGAVSGLDKVSMTASSKTWNAISGTWNGIPNGTTWTNL